MNMTFKHAAEMQQYHWSFYTVWLVSADGSREYLGCTQKKSGAGLLKFIQRETVQEVLRVLPNADAIEWTKKTATALFLSNGMQIAFGGTIRQESK